MTAVIFCENKVVEIIQIFPNIQFFPDKSYEVDAIS